MVNKGFIPGIQGWFYTSRSINVKYQINKRKDKFYMIVSIDADAFWQDPVYIHDKNSNKIGVLETFLIIVMFIYLKSVASISLSGEQMKVFSLRSGTRQTIFIISTVQYSFRGIRKSKQTLKKHQMDSNWKGRS